LAFTARFRGPVLQTGALTATVRAHSVGTVDGQKVDCTATYDVTGTRH
jgi:hypothetical protein